MKTLRPLMRLVALFAVLVTAACSGTDKYRINLLPTPDVYSSGLVNPFADNSPVDDLPYRGILYATDRKPSDPAGAAPYYTQEPGGLLRLGIGRIEIGVEGFTWEEARRVSLLKNRTQEYPLSVAAVEDIGPLDRSYNDFADPSLLAARPEAAGDFFAGLINKKLAGSQLKEIFIYVHGYNTNFEDPLLVASELWHFLGYDGVFIAYSWPATERGTAYLGDLEKAKLSSRNLRLFLEYLSEETAAERIHIVGYSMGTRVTTDALADLTLLHYGKTRAEIGQDLRIGNVILIGSDLSFYPFLGFLQDGLLDLVQSLTVYTSESDRALGASNWLFERLRLGQLTQNHPMRDIGRQYLSRAANLNFIEVTRAPRATEGNGHHYFRDSPWVSSDLLMTLMYDLPPGDRGLVRSQGSPIWQFPEDYIERLRAALVKANPKFEVDKGD